MRFNDFHCVITLLRALSVALVSFYLPEGKRPCSSNNCITSCLLWSRIRRNDENCPGELGVLGVIGEHGILPSPYASADVDRADSTSKFFPKNMLSSNLAALCGVRGVLASDESVSFLYPGDTPSYDSMSFGVMGVIGVISPVAEKIKWKSLLSYFYIRNLSCHWLDVLNIIICQF